MDKNEITRLIKENYDILDTEFGVSRIGIFGSVAKDRIVEDSDLDLVVEFNRPIGFKFIRLVEYLENLFGKKVDLLTKDGLKNIRIKEVAEDIERHLIYV
jgi:predicted nucleotidyltransferase